MNTHYELSPFRSYKNHISLCIPLTMERRNQIKMRPSRRVYFPPWHRCTHSIILLTLLCSFYEEQRGASPCDLLTKYTIKTVWSANHTDVIIIIIIWYFILMNLLLKRIEQLSLNKKNLSMATTIELLRKKNLFAFFFFAQFCHITEKKKLIAKKCGIKFQIFSTNFNHIFMMVVVAMRWSGWFAAIFVFHR